MSSSLSFPMGRFLAEFPVDRLYAKNHVWAQPHCGLFRFGFTAYAVRLLQDVYFLDWTIDPPAVLQLRQEIGAIESKKAASALFAPIAGELTAFNEQLLADPSMINQDPYGVGWLFEMRGESADLLTPEQYLKHLAAVWPLAQKTIRGKRNES